MNVISAFILIQTEVGKVAQVADALSRLEGIEHAQEVTGPYDIICQAHAEDLSALGESVTRAIQRIDGVTRTITCPATRIIEIENLD